MRVFTLLLGALALGTAAVAAGPYYVVASGGYSGYDMSTVNAFLDSVNEAAGTAAFEPLDSGASFCLGLGRIYSRRLATTVVYERLAATAESTSPEVIGLVKAPANVIRLDVAYARARMVSVIPFVAGGVGIVWNNGHVEYRDDLGHDRRHDFAGDNLTLEGLVGVEIRLGQRLGLSLAGGYRLADVKSPEWDATSFGGYGTFTEGEFDYSGPVARVGLRIGLGWQTGDAGETRDASEGATGWM